MRNYDIVVVGGGFSGAAAAIAAAREGKSVLLIEKTNALGGAATMCLVNPFMPFWTGDDCRPLSAGLFAEIQERMHELEIKYHGKSFGRQYFSEEYLKIVLNRMCKEAGAELLFDAVVVKTNRNGNRIESADVYSQGNLFGVSANVFIDATGDGNLAFMSGCPCRTGREDGLCQPMTLCFRLSNVDMEKMSKNLPAIQKEYKAAQAAGKIKNPRENVLVFHTLDKIVCHLNSTRVVRHNPTDPFELSKAEEIVREQVFELFEFLRTQPGYENATLGSTAAQIGIRESRMIDGDYILTQEDLIGAKKFDDSIACGNYDIDIHNPEGSGTSHYYFPNNVYYTIPYRSLIPLNADNLLVVGRCISATHEAQASIRIMPIVCCIGEAGGLAASLVDNGGSVRSVDIEKLHNLLDKNKGIYR